MSTLRQQYERLDAISRQRRLSDDESEKLEIIMRRLGLIRKRPRGAQQQGSSDHA